MALNLSPAKLDAWMRRKKGKQNLIERDAPGMRLRGARTLNEMDALEPYDDPEAQTTSDDAEFDAMVNAANAKKAQREAAKTKATPTQEPSQEPPVGYREETSEDLKNPDDAPQTPETNEARRKGIYMSGLENLEPAAEEAVETPAQENQEGPKWNDPTQLNELLYKDEGQMTPEEKAFLTPKSDTSYEDDQQRLQSEAFDAGEVPGADALGAASKPSAEPAKPVNQDLTDDDVSRILGKKPGRLSNLAFMLTGGMAGENRLGYNREANDLKMLRQRSNEAIRTADPKLTNALEKEEIKVAGRERVESLRGSDSIARARIAAQASVQRGEMTAAAANRKIASLEKIAKMRADVDREEAQLNKELGLGKASISAEASMYGADARERVGTAQNITQGRYNDDRIALGDRGLKNQKAIADARNKMETDKFTANIASRELINAEKMKQQAAEMLADNKSRETIAAMRIADETARSATRNLNETASKLGLPPSDLNYLLKAMAGGDPSARVLISQLTLRMMDQLEKDGTTGQPTPADSEMIEQYRRSPEATGNPPLGR